MAFNFTLSYINLLQGAGLPTFLFPDVKPDLDQAWEVFIGGM